MPNLTEIIINDGNGDQCGFDYNYRCSLAQGKITNPKAWLTMVRQAALWRKNYLGLKYHMTDEEIRVIAQEVANYYAEHIKEMEGS